MCEYNNKKEYSRESRNGTNKYTENDQPLWNQGMTSFHISGNVLTHWVKLQKKMIILFFPKEHEDKQY